MGSCETVRLKCDRETLEALATGLTHFAPAAGEPDWLVSAAWLRANGRQYLMAATIDVLSNGLVARGLSIGSPEDFAGQLQAAIPDTAARLASIDEVAVLPPIDTLSPPPILHPWSAGPYATKVLVRVSRRGSITNRIACGLQFAALDGRSLLVGSDLSTLALVLSADRSLIERYCDQCEALTTAEYLATED